MFSSVSVLCTYRHSRHMSLWYRGLKQFEAQAVETLNDYETDVDDLHSSSEESYESDFINDTDYPLSKQQIREFRGFPLQPSKFDSVEKPSVAYFTNYLGKNSRHGTTRKSQIECCGQIGRRRVSQASPYRRCRRCSNEQKSARPGTTPKDNH